MAELRASNCKLFSSLGRGEGYVCVCVRACVCGWKCNERDAGQLMPSGHVFRPCLAF